MAHPLKTFHLALLIVALQGLIAVVNSQCDGVCVAMNRCKTNTFGGNSIIDIRIGDDEDEIEGECDHYLEVCCDKEGVQDEPIRLPGPLPDNQVKPENADIQNEPEGPRGPVENDNFRKENDFDQMFDNPMTFDNCGIRNKDGVGFRISNAKKNETEFGEFPWTVAIMLEDEDDTKYVCGGSLIKPNMVLTAAHCVYNKSHDKLTVRAGEWDSKTTNEILIHQDRQVSEVVVHDGFNKQFLFNDVALLILANAFNADEHIQLLCLPPKGMVFDEDNCFATGWGKGTFDAPSYQAILKKVQLPLVSHAACQTALRTTRLGPNFRLHSTFQCAGGRGGVDTCTGDGGSPLICSNPDNPDQYYQAGIVAWGIGCGQEGIPGVYVKSTLYTDWINEMVQFMEF